MNITTDNYEAYLLDYMEGNLSPEGATELQAFIAAQGLDWEKLTEELPHLEAPRIGYPNKESLKKKATVVPLYVKIASAAAAAGLLLTVSLWPEKSMPKVEPVANLKPIEVNRIDTHKPLTLLPRRASENIDPLPRTGLRRNDMLSEGQNKEGIASEKEIMPLMAELPMKNITSIQTNLPSVDFDTPDFDFLAWRMNANLAFAQPDEFDFADDEDERNLSFIGKGLYRLTNGNHDSFASIISSGLSTAKKEISLAATDMALTAYHRADERIEEAKERWQEK